MTTPNENKPAAPVEALDGGRCAVADGSASDTPRTDRWEYEQECNFDVPWEDHCRELEREVARLRTALADADMAISAGQACRSEAEFTRWMRDSQRYRPHADLLSPNGAAQTRRT